MADSSQDVRSPAVVKFAQLGSPALSMKVALLGAGRIENPWEK
jgi:hypothetical protein